MTFERGAVYRYNYLWAREFDRGEESGRKARPVCLVVRTSTEPESLFLFPLTSREPAADAPALKLPESECRLAGVHPPCWIILAEYNVAHVSRPHDFADIEALGRFNHRFLERIAAAIKKAATERRLRAIHRS